MKIKKIYIGSWFPKTGLHLNEFIDFLRWQKVIDLLEEKQAKKLHAKLKPYGVIEKESEDMRYVQTQSGKFLFKYFSDGLLIVESEKFNSFKDFEKLLNFYQQKLSPCLSFLFSVGAKGLELIREPGLRKIYYLACEKATRNDIDKLFKKNNYVLESIVDYREFSVYRAEGLTLIGFYEEINDKQLNILMEYLIMLDEVKRHLVKLLHMHRRIWEASEKIYRANRVRVKELPDNAAKLTEYLTEIANIQVRLQQMQINLDYREVKAREFEGLYENLRVEFINVKQNLDYIKNIFAMSEMQLKNTSKHLSSIYQENQQNSLFRLQMLFLVSMISSLLMLGSFTGASLYFYDRDKNAIAFGKMISFDPMVLLKWGTLTIGVSFIIFVLWNYIFGNIKAKIKK